MRKNVTWQVRNLLQKERIHIEMYNPHQTICSGGRKTAEKRQRRRRKK